MTTALKSLLLAASFWLCAVGAALAASCAPDAVGTAGSQAKAARQALAELPVDPEWPTVLEPTAQTAIAAMKARLGDLLDAYMDCAPRDLDTSRAAEDLSEVLAAPEPAADAQPHYGDHLSVAVERPANQPRLVAMTAQFAIPCGTDAVLLIFAPEGGHWKEALRWQSRPYPEVDGAFASFGYAISPPDAVGRWFLVTKTVAPWCSSTWSTIRYAVSRPDPDRSMPRILYAAEDAIWWGGDDLGELAVSRDGFDLRFHSNSIDTMIHNRVWVRRYRVKGDLVRRLPPVAVSPRDFADEWIVSDWIAASAWSNPDRRDELRSWHARLQSIHSFEYAAVRRCGSQADRYQVELAPETEDGRFYLRIEGPASAFRMTAISAKPEPACDGPDLLDSMATQ